jgi:hypothetical protein
VSDTGTTTTSLPGARIDEGKGRMFPCASCGADMVFNIGVQKLKCDFCGAERNLDVEHARVVAERDLDSMFQQLASRRVVRPVEGVRSVRCGSCGSEVEFSGNLSSKHCCYCGSPIQEEMIQNAAEDRISIDAVLPFAVPGERARAAINAWISSLWWAPNDFLRSKAEDRLSGVYLPYWTFDSATFTSYTGQRGEHYWVTVGTGKNRRRERRTRWYPASGNFSRFFDDVLVVASAGLPDKQVLQLEPWPLHECLPFTQEVLAGYLVKKYDVELPDGFKFARSRIDAALEADVRQRIGGDVQRIHSIDTHHDACTFKHVLLPVWMYAHRYKGETYRIIVNATTGEVQGERPYSAIKIIFAVLAGLIAAAIIFIAVRAGAA